MEVDVLVIGGGASGTAAGIQSARMGVETLIIEETPWLGGMITSAGVSAFDGNKYAVGGGIFGELRHLLEEYYGGPEKTYTGWISLTCFEPKIGKKFLHQLVKAEPHLSVWHESSLLEVYKTKNKITGALIKLKDGSALKINCKVIIEATEFGDVLPLAGIPYRLGRDAKSDTYEADAPDNADDEIQDMTYCAILKKYPANAPPVTVDENFDFSIFKNSTSVDSDTNDENLLNHKLHSWDSFISYAALPNDKYLLNWPFRSNDYPNTCREIYENAATRSIHFKKAKELVLAYVSYIQTKLGHPEWGLATDEFPTPDFLPFIPYIRESRRMKGEYLMVEKDVIPDAGSFRPPLMKDGIAVGDYFLDHHHSSFFKEPGKRLDEKLPANAPFQISYRSLIPQKVDGFIAAEKSISVSHIVNGCSRLQPVVMLIGQAAGAAAALSVKNNVEPRNLNIDELQNELLIAGCQLYPYKDIYNTHPAFEAIQCLALKGLIIDESDFEFKPDSIVTSEEAIAWRNNIQLKFDTRKLIGQKRADAFLEIYSQIKQSKI
ncbi:MAG: FAD-dependent oxidoreductase [Ignavibacteriaceae bacterium]|nr:FAD-dependent oxidoreductase [Ignavibacteriaceae bacterium]